MRVFPILLSSRVGKLVEHITVFLVPFPGPILGPISGPHRALFGARDHVTSSNLHGPREGGMEISLISFISLISLITLIPLIYQIYSVDFIDFIDFLPPRGGGIEPATLWLRAACQTTELYPSSPGGIYSIDFIDV